MKSKIKVLHISPFYDYSCGVSKYLSILFKEFLDAQEFEIHFITNGGDKIQELKNFNIKYDIIPFNKGLKNFFYLISFREKLSKYISENQIDIIHTHHRFPEYVVSTLSKKNKYKTISTVHSITRGLEFLSYKSSKIIAVSNAVKNNLIKRYRVSENKIVQLYNPIVKEINKIDKAIAKKELEIGLDKKVIFFIGRICKDKGVDLLIKAFSLLDDESLLLVLLGKIYDIDESLIKCDKRIKYFSSQPETSKFYSAADILILPSRFDSFPFTMLEAGLYKVPFVGSDVDGIKEFITHNEDGLLFQKENVSDLTQKLKLLLNNDELKMKVAENLYQKVNKLDDPKEYVNKLKSIYSELLNGNTH